MLYKGEQTLLNELTLLLAVFLLANLLVALWRVARCPTAADRLLAAMSSPSQYSRWMSGDHALNSHSTFSM